MPTFHMQRTGDVAHRFAGAAPDEDVVYGACSPGWHSAAPHDEALADWLAFLDRRNVDRVCCLVPGRPVTGSGGNLDHYRRAFGVDRVLHAPTPDHRLVDEGTLAEEVLPFLDDAVATDERVVVHCLDGIGRTGLVLAVWLAHDRGYEPERAIETVTEMGRDPTDAVRAGNATKADLHVLIRAFA